MLNKYKKMSVPAKAAIWFTLCSLLQKGISFITVPLFTRILSTEQYGIYSLYISWLQILTIITSFYLYYGVFNNAMVKFESDKKRYISSMQGLTLVLTVIVFMIYIIFHNFWNAIIGLSTIIMILMFIEMLVTPALSFWSGSQRFEYKYKKLVFVTLGKSIINPILGLIAVLVSTDKATARIVSIVITELFFCGIIMIKQFRDGRCFFDKKYWKYALIMAIPLIPHYLSSMILNQGDRVMISKLIGASEVAFYSVAYNIGMLIQLFTNAINNSFTPWLYQKIKKDDFSNVSNIINVLLFFVGIIVVCLILCSPEIILIFGSSSYISATYVIPPVAASVFFIFLYNILAVPQFYYEKTQYLLISSILAALVNIGLNYIFIKRFGYIAAGYTTLICYILYSVCHYIISQKILRNKIKENKLFDKKIILILSIIIVCIVGISNLLFNYRVIRYFCFAIILITIILKKEKILDIFKTMKNK